MKYYLYNSLSNNGIKPEFLEIVERLENTEIKEIIDLDYQEFLKNLKEEDELVIVGGDGTLNYFVNEIKDLEINNKIYYRASGTGNDFMHDIEKIDGEEILINQYVHNLPTVYVKDVERKFLNGVGYGIDGYCCEVADEIKKKTPNKKINYTGIAIKGLLFHFKSATATITVDGREYVHENVWIAPTMKGRFYGGGMMIAPNQDRLSGEVSVVVYHAKSRLKALMSFPSIFKGEHIKKEKMVSIYTGKEITVKFDRSCALQIDGETVLDVTEYKVVA
ncbi:MAG: diacylglycerol kinase family protein [Bacilli bacterium]|nr:diacylglycerol kinase family protein [Bacilli bacterium]